MFHIMRVDVIGDTSPPSSSLIFKSAGLQAFSSLPGQRELDDSTHSHIMSSFKLCLLLDVFPS